MAARRVAEQLRLTAAQRATVQAAALAATATRTRPVENSQPRHHRQGPTGHRLHAFDSPGSTAATGEHSWRHAPHATYFDLKKGCREAPPVQWRARFSQQRLLLGVDLTVVLDLELDRCDVADLALVRGPRGLPLHVSARCDLSIEVWEEEMEEPADWSLGLPVELLQVWLWTGDDSIVAEIGELPVLH
ncbi:MAG: hypothetical protein M3P85_01170 [Actinomycetota bacterium]|nr:hypothetical protein [Actinomycetota bacterium]